MKQKQIYLAGAITHLADPQTWRNQAIAILAECDIVGIDPLKWEAKDFPPAEIVALDYGLILQSQAVIVDCSTPSWGTAMELAFAKQVGRPVFGWNGQERMSPWLVYHTSAIDSNLEQACSRAAFYLNAY